MPKYNQNIENLFGITVKNSVMSNTTHDKNLIKGDFVIFDKSLEAKPNKIAIVENKYNDTFIVLLDKNPKNELIGRFISEDYKDVVIPVERVLGIATKKISNIRYFRGE
ncbi:hypothetical protein [Francisella sp. TX07-6608]|uniref:hypothetical protein n=1 Tax=Francisella sp. TX07-6608 TaxID=573568 RepID=UPI00116049FA|nr:hypothetical protein [Francisella sp. TX07-6608]